MRYALLVMGAPYVSQAPYSALRFAHALIRQGHTLESVFFYHNGVHNASLLITPPQGGECIRSAWQALYHQHSVKLDVCIAAALQRGLVDAAEANRHGYVTYNVEPPFELTGLGQLITLQQRCDRVVTFAP
ncbi:sulfurtransferase complex subunit TusD [Vreelandella massiliensis]|uniref:sulfurtransferase complex subunit TusD n=1 Tax=Vreelandella massiliensis TaxID=1816686 RepID=UPI00096A9BE3|nr:sulfurtransferase complex subunit TusD [Halomonas massiliensis]MYL24075.1 sulfurtransferase complex subunit TusD [Halomonas alkaliantarctica]